VTPVGAALAAAPPASEASRATGKGDTRKGHPNDTGTRKGYPDDNPITKQPMCKQKDGIETDPNQPDCGCTSCNKRRKWMIGAALTVAALAALGIWMYFKRRNNTAA